MDTEKIEALTLRIPAELAAWLREIAKRELRSVNAQIEKILREAQQRAE